MILPAQMIRKLCIDGWRVPPAGAELELIRISIGSSYYTSEVRKLIDPFVERGEFQGKTYGIGPCSYDLRSRQSFVLRRGEFKLCSSIERVAFPYYVCGTILDKSSWARKGVSAFNTHFDPGFHGYPTIELVNHGPEDVEIVEGMAIVQMKFEQLVAPTDSPYMGKYNNQADRPVEAIEGEGAWGVRLPDGSQPAIAGAT